MRDEQALSDLERQVDGHLALWREATQERGLPLPRDRHFLKALRRVLEGSEYVARTLQRHPELLRDLLAEGDLLGDHGPGELDRQLRDWLAGVADEAGLQSALRRFRQKQMVRVIWRDLAGWAPLAETLEDLSALADACVSQALDLLHGWLTRELGTPLDPEGRPQRLLVLGMGKLGARELNLSSDIDLIFAFRQHAPLGGHAYLTCEQFFLRLAQRLIQALHAQTGEGFVFRVDTRLRPFGEAGPLALSFTALEDYYQAQAREWERYAMVKARVVAGDAEDAQRVMAILEPFVYRRYLDYGAIESLRELKRLISRELIRKGMEQDIKLGPGGIREVEFIGQVFQIIRGGRDPQLRVRPILEVLDLLRDKGLLPLTAAHELQAAYRFLRRVENRVQAWRDQQTHQLPTDPQERLRLARAMGYPDWPEFLIALDDWRQRVQRHFDEVFASGEESPPERELAHLWNETLDPARALDLLAEAGFRDPPGALERLRQFHQSRVCRELGSRGQERLERLMPLLLETIARNQAPTAAGDPAAPPTDPPVPDLTLERLLKLLEAVARRTAYLALLVENASALTQLVRLTAASPWVAQQLARQPLLLDELLDPRRLLAPLRHQELQAELDRLLAAVDPEDQEQQMERLRQFAHGNMLRVAAADLSGTIRLMVVSDYLTDIAEVAVGAVLQQSWTHLTRRHGQPQGVLGRDTGFAVIGYGKLGGIELGYASDLDLVFLHGNQNPQGMTDGAAPLANDVLYARLGQRIIHMLHTQTPSGILYEVDTRLRPDGGAGLLVSSLDAFAQYQANAAWTWEHQALLRARPIAGDPLVANRFQRIRREVLSRERDPERLRGEVRDMRDKMRQQLDRSGRGRFDLKQGPGGIADIEFMVQYLVLRWANRHPQLLDWTDNIRLLVSLSRLGLLPEPAASDLGEAYRTLRMAYHRNRLQNEPGLIPDERLGDTRERVRGLWRELLG